jgi:hypothetical protein
MAAELFDPYTRVTDANADALSGAKIYFYQTGTLVLQSVYTDADLQVAHTNPVEADAGGLFAPIYLDSSKTYRAIFKDASGNPLGLDIDPVANSSFLLPLTGAVSRSDDEKLADFVSVKDFGAVGDGTTSDQTALAAAVAAAYADGLHLYWPDGTYKSTANIPYLNSVRHFGPGAILRSSNTFYVDPKRSQSNTLYVSTTGSTANDGLSTSQPLTIPGAWDALANYGPDLAGKWNVSLAAGTYTSINSTFPIGLKSEYPVVIEGPSVGGSPNVPTAIIDGGSSSNIAIRARGNNSLYVKNIKFKNHSVSGGCGVAVIGGGGFLATDNVHGENNYDTLICYSGRLYVGGGIFDLSVGNYSGVRSMFNTTHTIGGVYDIDTGLAPYPGVGLGPLFTATTRTARGVLIQENSTGHVESCTFNNLSNGINVLSSSRAHSADNTFKKCTVCYEVESGSNVFDGASSNNAYNVGTADANLQIAHYYGHSEETYSFSSSVVPVITDMEFTPTPGSVTGTLTETTLHTFTDYLRGHEFSRFGMLRMRVVGSMVGTAGNKTIRMRVAGSLTSSIIFNSAANGKFVAELTMVMSGANTQQNYSWGITNGNGTGSGVGDGDNTTTAVTLATGSPVTITLTGELGNTGDTLTIAYIEMIRGGS